MILKYAYYRPCSLCRGGIYRGDHWYKWDIDRGWLKVCSSCDRELMVLPWYERQSLLESVLNSVALDRMEIPTKVI